MLPANHADRLVTQIPHSSRKPRLLLGGRVSRKTASSSLVASGGQVMVVAADEHARRYRSGDVEDLTSNIRPRSSRPVPRLLGGLGHTGKLVMLSPDLKSPLPIACATSGFMVR